jgi:hypothetical protein
MTQRDSKPASPREQNPALVVAAFTQASENIRHIRSERIWFCNAYGAIIAGGLAILPRDLSTASNRRVLAIGLIFLVLFSLVSLACSIRLVAELRDALANLTRLASENGMEHLVGTVDQPRGFGATMPMRWVFPIFYSLTAGALVVLLLVHLVR